MRQNVKNGGLKTVRVMGEDGYGAPPRKLRYFDPATGCLQIEGEETTILEQGHLLLEPFDIGDEGVIRGLPAGTKLMFGQTHGCSLTEVVKGEFDRALTGTTICLKTGNRAGSEPVDLRNFNSAYIVLN